MKNKYENIISITCIWRGLVNTEQIKQYNKFIEDNNLYNTEVTKWEDNELGGQHDWFIFHNGDLTNKPHLIIDELVEIDDTRILNCL